ncbi:Rossmann-like and DUF2520 domain-containing protein [Sphingobacterium bovistauri]|uniref:DUF2520 domain-containing protein n=1 Tax=Sphingobacterium bovistauri TaxID=2781959 RepID=A0ABS7Z944_9SPHI|nr:Rossmann-like and DUF2520 domain-containing protein [Sphingobacterium bovistauri]MCA5006528.1 DUF2520 domain-containing protein [Sphingobacterium bovistauri]
MNAVIIGSGNIATHLAKTLYTAGHTISQVYSRTLANAQALANVVNSDCINDLSKILLDADLYILSVSDSAIPEITNNLNKNIKGIIVHTSGATDMNILDEFENYGVVYPPQSINKDIDTDLNLIPFAIEANTFKNEEMLLQLIKTIASKSFYCNSNQRLALHLSAVIANNFSNALFQISKDILDNANLDFELLKPIILETAIKVQNHLPETTQTGPARRADYNIIDKHLQFLSQFPEESKIYQILTDFIIKRYHK